MHAHTDTGIDNLGVVCATQAQQSEGGISHGQGSLEARRLRLSLHDFHPHCSSTATAPAAGRSEGAEEPSETRVAEEEEEAEEAEEAKEAEEVE